MAVEVGRVERMVNGNARDAIIIGDRSGPRALPDPAVLLSINALNLEDPHATVEVVDEEDAGLSRNAFDSQRMAGRQATRKVAQEEVQSVEDLLAEAISARDARIAAASAPSSNGCYCFPRAHACPCELQSGRKKGDSLPNPHAAPSTAHAPVEDASSIPLSLRLRKAKYDPGAFDFWGYVATAPKVEKALIASIPIVAAASVFFWGSILGFF